MELLGVEIFVVVFEKIERSDESVEVEKKEKVELGEICDGNGVGDVDGDGKVV